MLAIGRPDVVIGAAVETPELVMTGLVGDVGNYGLVAVVLHFDHSPA